MLASSLTSGELLVTLLFVKMGLGGNDRAPPDLVSRTVFLVWIGGPEERVGCKAVLGCPVALEGRSEVLVLLLPVLKRAIIVLTSDLLSC